VPICSGRLKEAKVTVEISGAKLGSFDGLQCERCGEEFLLPKSTNVAHATALSKNLFGKLKEPESMSTLPHESLAYEIRSVGTVVTPLTSTNEISLANYEVEISTSLTGSSVEITAKCE